MKNYVPDFSKIPPSIKGRMMAKSIFSREGKVVDFVEYYFEVLHFV